MDYTNSYYEIKEKEIIVLVDCDDFYLESMDHLARTYNVNDGANGSLNDNNILLDLITRCSTDIGTGVLRGFLNRIEQIYLSTIL